jgi:two-component system OmpR family response regulator
VGKPARFSGPLSWEFSWLFPEPSGWPQQATLLPQARTIAQRRFRLGNTSSSLSGFSDPPSPAPDRTASAASISIGGALNYSLPKQNQPMRILVIEDELDLAVLIRAALTRENIVCDHVQSIELATEAILTGSFGCVILDRNLPDGDGLSLLPTIRGALPGTAVVVLSALRSAGDKIKGLNLGADDYLQKPFVIDELIARVRAVARRSPGGEEQTLCVGRLSLDPVHGSTTVAGSPFPLSRREFLILEALIRRPGLVVRRSALMDSVYSFDDEVQSTSIETHVSRLRRKLEDSDARAEIHTVRGLGYVLKAADTYAE